MARRKTLEDLKLELKFQVWWMQKHKCRTETQRIAQHRQLQRIVARIREIEPTFIFRETDY